MTTTRRGFLGMGAAGLSFVSLAGGAPEWFARAAASSARADKNDHALVVIELAGGNDGLNTFIPCEDPLYYQNRRTLGIPKGDVLKVGDGIGFHPRMGPMAELFAAGRLAVVQGVGYPKPDRSHFRSMEIWHTAQPAGVPPPAGWLGRCLDELPEVAKGESALRGVALNDLLPQALQAERAFVPVVAQLDGLVNAEAEQKLEAKTRRRLSTARGSLGANEPLAFLRKQAETLYRTADQLKAAAANYKSSIEYPQTDLGGQLRRAAQIIASDLGVRVLFASQGGYDTHAAQAGQHGNLLAELSEALAVFDKDLTAHERADRVCVMIFSEFGRRVDENASKGTDHGAASCVFLAGAKVNGGLHGQRPSLERLGEGDLIFTTDFRSVYATLLEDWLGCPAATTLGATFPKLNLLKS